MKSNEIKILLNKSLLLDEVYVNNDGNHCDIIAVGKIFMNISKVNRQKLIYAPLMSYVVNSIIHSISIRAYTPEEWEKYKLLL